MYEQLDFSQYIYGIPLDQADFLMNDAHEVQYNDICLDCRKDCKQSFRCSIVQCPYFHASRKGRAKKAALQG